MVKTQSETRPSKISLDQNLKKLLGKGSIYEKVQKNLKNIIYCLNFLVDLAQSKAEEAKQATLIQSNKGF